MKTLITLVLCVGTVWSAQASTIVDFRPTDPDAATTINVTAGKLGAEIYEVAIPLIDNVNGRTGLGQGDSWGGTGLIIGGSAITFANTQIVDYEGNAGSTFRTDANGNGMGIDSPTDGEAWYLIDGLESFTWTASSELQWEGFTLRSFGSNSSRALKVSSSDWIGLAGVNPGTGVTFDALTGIFTIENIVDNAAADGLTLDELVGAGGPTLDFASIKIANAGTTGTAIQTMTFAAIPEPATVGLLGLSTVAVMLIRRFKI